MLNYSNSVIPFKLLLFLHCKHLPNRFIVLISSRYMKSDTNFSFLYSAKTWRWWTYLLVLHVGGCCLFVLLFYLKFLKCHLKCLDLFKMEIRFILMRSQPIKKLSRKKIKRHLKNRKFKQRKKTYSHIN